MVEIGRIDFSTKVSLLSSHLVYPWEKHLESALHVMDYLEQKHNSWLVSDPTYPKIDESIFKNCDWKDFYGDPEEAIPPSASKPCSKDVDLWAKFDRDHTGDKETRKLQTRYLIYCYMSLVDYLFKNQPRIERFIFMLSLLCWSMWWKP